MDIKITVQDAEQRLDRWLKKRRPDIPHGLVQKLLRKGAIKLNGKRAKADVRLQKGDKVTLPDTVEQKATKAVNRRAVPNTEQALQLLDNILAITNDYIAINKPAGLAAQGGSNVKISVDDLTPYLREPWLSLHKAKKKLPTLGEVTSGDMTPKLVHRIDKDTSGIMLLARNDVAARTLTAAFKAKDICKTYWALVVGVPSHRQGKISAPLVAKSAVKKIEKAVVDEEQGKSAVTYYTVVEAMGSSLAWVALQPVTGRMHQLRVHMAHIGHPIVGDGKYGGKAAFIDGVAEQMHLHARRVQHPKIFGKAMDITASLPPHMRASWKLFDMDANDKEDYFTSV